MNNVLEQQIADIIASKIKMQKQQISEDDWEKPLTGTTMQLSSVDMVYLLFEVEKSFGIRIEEEHLRD